MNSLLSFGHGYCARAFARLLDGQGWKITGTTRTPETTDLLAWPGTDMEPYLDTATHLLISIAPTMNGDPVLNELRDAIAARADQFTWVGYLSTTAVYGDRGGDWVDETAALDPSTQRGRWRVAAEESWASIPGLPLHIFRLAGIYGPGRGPFAKVRAATARRIIKPGQVFSRIHRDDIAQVLLASVNKPDPGAIYNVCDDNPAPPQDVIEHAARLLDLPVPEAERFEDADMTPMARSFYAESKRVRNARIKRELGVRLIYPDYRSGLNALLKAELNG